ncbi:MAG: DUF1858 domain-containing protein [archaeon]
MITKKDTLGDIMTNYPEAAPVLAQAGLHCIGCHVSVYETLEEGCQAHGLNPKEIDQLVIEVNKKIKEFESAPKVAFSQNAVTKLLERVKGKKYVRIVNNLMGEFDFVGANTKTAEEFITTVEGSKSKKKISVDVLMDKRTEKGLRGVIIDYDPKEKDFTAKRV